MKTSSHVLSFVLLLSVLLCGCTAQQQNNPSLQTHDHAMAEPPEPAPTYDRLTVYSPLPEQETLVYCSAFRKDTGITVDCVYLPAGEMAARLEQEQDAPRASVLLGGSADHYIQLREAGLLEAYQSPELLDVPEAYQDADGVWNPIYIGTLCFACNRDWFERTGTPLPTCWDDLLSPALAGQIVMADPKSSGTSYTTLATLVQARGEDKAWEYLRKLAQNIREYPASSTEAVRQVSEGNDAVTIVFYHDGRRAVLNGRPLELVTPFDGTGYEIGACALLRNGLKQEQENARVFMNWITSARGQECYIEAKSCRLPANSTARAADGLPALNDLNLISYDMQWAGANRTRLVQQFTEIINGAIVGGIGFVLYMAFSALGWSGIALVVAIGFGLESLYTFLSTLEWREKDKESVSYSIMWGTAALALLMLVPAVMTIKQALGL